MVRLKAFYSYNGSRVERSFNSNMVRLKATNPVTGYVVDTFQFQYGTIKRFETEGALSGSILFQFQYGTIKRIE